MKNTVDMHKTMLDKRGKTISDIRSGSNGWRDYPYKKGFADKLQEDQDWETKSYKEAKIICDKALKDYEKTPLYKLRQAQKTIEKGKRAVMNLFKK